MTDLFSATIKQYIYGTSGTELPPPVEKVKSTTFLSLPTETKEEFERKVQEYGMALRIKAANVTPRPYSQRDGIDWSISCIEPRPYDFDSNAE